MGSFLKEKILTSSEVHDPQVLLDYLQELQSHVADLETQVEILARRARSA